MVAFLNVALLLPHQLLETSISRVLPEAIPILAVSFDKITELCISTEKLPAVTAAIIYSTFSNKHPSNNLWEAYEVPSVLE